MTDSKIEGNTVKKPPNAGKGRPKGAKNKTTALLKDAILQAAAKAGATDKSPDGDLVAYLQKQATECPGPFLALLGKVLPMQVTGEDGKAIKHDVRFIIVSGHQGS